MKILLVLLAIVGFVAAGRPVTEDVIATFKRVVPVYKSVMEDAQSRIITIKSNVTNELVNFHLNIINMKELYVQRTILREDYILQQMNLQPTVDPTCLSFVRSSSEMNVNLGGVSFTNCINTADESVRTKLESYSGTVGNLEQQLQDLRLLDVFRGSNVFHQPEPIIGRLNEKLAFLQSLNETIVADGTLSNIANTVVQDLVAIGANYNSCMDSAYNLLAQSLNMCEMQMTLICGAKLPCDIGGFPCAEA